MAGVNIMKYFGKKKMYCIYKGKIYSQGVIINSLII